MRNKYLQDRTSADIDKQVHRILKDLGNPQPPLRLEVVRDLLSLDKRYYSSTNDSATREFLHKLTLSGKQLFKRPRLIVDVIKQWELKALYLPDRKRILLDEELPPAKQRWGEAHEVGHAIIPWHEALMLGDDKQTLRPACHAQLEAEANYAAGRMLFLRDHFMTVLSDHSLSIETIKSLSKQFGNTMTTTLWRAIETVEIPAVGVISVHPRHLAEGFDAASPCKYLIRSRAFEKRFSARTEIELFTAIQGYCTYSKRGPIGNDEVVLADDAGVEHVFVFETFYNTHEALTLGIYASTKPTIVSA